MSSTGRSDIREPDDFYKTPAWASRAILPHLDLDERSVVLDPCCGDGAILDVVAEAHPGAQRLGIEIDSGRVIRAQARHPIVHHRDALTIERWPDDVTHAITNPPFKIAIDIITRARVELARRDGIIAMLLRVNFLASGERRAFHKANPADIHVLSRRPSFAAALFCMGAGKKRKDGCGWDVLQEIDAPRAKTCPSCGVGKVGVTTSDSTEYAWWVWGPGRGGRWFLLDEVAA